MTACVHNKVCTSIFVATSLIIANPETAPVSIRRRPTGLHTESIAQSKRCIQQKKSYMKMTCCTIVFRWSSRTGKTRRKKFRTVGRKRLGRNMSDLAGRWWPRDWGSGSVSRHLSKFRIGNVSDFCISLYINSSVREQKINIKLQLMEAWWRV